jgi:hypothetical protein
MKHPHIEYVMLAIAQDQGIYRYPYAATEIEFKSGIHAIELLFAKFTGEQLRTLATGDQEKWPAVYKAAKVCGDDREVVHAALDCIFETAGI